MNNKHNYYVGVLPPFLLRSNSSPSLRVWLRAWNKTALSSCKLCQCHFWGARETRSAKYRELPKLPNMFHNKSLRQESKYFILDIYQEPYFKGAVLQHSSSFCLILSITRPQWLWNLKSAKKLHVITWALLHEHYFWSCKQQDQLWKTVRLNSFQTP